MFIAAVDQFDEDEDEDEPGPTHSAVACGTWSRPTEGGSLTMNQGFAVHFDDGRGFNVTVTRARPPRLVVGDGRLPDADGRPQLLLGQRSRQPSGPQDDTELRELRLWSGHRPTGVVDPGTVRSSPAGSSPPTRRPPTP
jgi:hypothetical protein